MDSPSFFAIIPAYVRYNKNLEAAAKLLYGEITALANAQGYCWATNKYFSEIYSVDVSTIKRWIKSLKDENFIKIEIEKTGIQTVRKIWISSEIKKMSTTGQKCPVEGSNSNCREVKNEPHINTSISTKNKKETAPLADAYVSFGKFVFLEKKEHEELNAQFGSKNVLAMIDEINDYLASTGKKPYKDYAAAIRNWMRRKQQMPRKSQPGPIPVGEKSRGEMEAENRTWKSNMEKTLFQWSKEGKIYFGTDYIEVLVDEESQKIYVHDPLFVAAAKNAMKRIGAFV